MSTLWALPVFYMKNTKKDQQSVGAGSGNGGLITVGADMGFLCYDVPLSVPWLFNTR